MIAKLLILVSHELVKFKDKQTGLPIEKHKYLFMKADGTYLAPQFDESGFYADDVVDLRAGWDESKAKHFPFDLKEFNGIVTEKLASGRSSTSDKPKKK